jgi:hypothetical protein
MPATTGLSPAQENDAMNAYLAGGFVEVEEA